ncbi:hypothetical protein AVEN_242164-1 [Araneus ventricosus]|uniref:Uncharacterized protein n=1 Tax=Araneus ventricosus TaxID=182803 RepID=A0A4Y2DEM5_ARAVE|nr:hypothetical protein AVEN_242164-1 [Araneus ventricosus]
MGNFTKAQKDPLQNCGRANTCTRSSSLVPQSELKNLEETKHSIKALPPLYLREYRTTPTAALQTIFGIPPLHLQIQYEAQSLLPTWRKRRRDGNFIHQYTSVPTRPQ